MDPEDLINRLGLEVKRKLGSEAYLDPLCHESASGESLQVNLHTGSWNCKACATAGMRGDLFHLVEYALTNGQAPEKGEGGGPGRTDALRWLCTQFGEPFHEGRDDEQDEALLGLETFVLSAANHLLERPDVLAWIERQWGFDIDTVISYRIGFMPSPLLPEIVKDAEQNKARYRTSGLGWYMDGKFQTRFEGRVTFPYLELGRPVYLIGRATPWTPMIPVEGRAPVTPPKYYKLPVHSETKSWISPSITNNHLFNEPVLKACGHEVGVLEGITDGVAFSAIGINVVSPVTINFNGPDLERFVQRCHENGVSVVWILFDNELSGSGNWAAIETGSQLIEGGLETRVITLPPGAEQLAAIEEVSNEIGETNLRELERLSPTDRKRRLVEMVPDDNRREWVKSQINAAKIDGAEWVAAQGAGAAQEFEKLKRTAQSVVSLLADRVAETLDADDEPFIRQAAFTDLVELVAHLDSRQHRVAGAEIIAAAAGKGVSRRSDIEPSIAEARREVVSPKRKQGEEKRVKEGRDEISAALVPLPPVDTPAAPIAPSPNADPSIPAPKKKITGVSADEACGIARSNVAKSLKAGIGEETVGAYIAETLKVTLGYMPFRTRDGVIIVRKNERVLVSTERQEPFRDVLYMVSGLTPRKGAHGSYIAAVEFHLGRGARTASDVSWSHVAEDRAVFFPMGDTAGRLLRIAPGQVDIVRMHEVRVPAVAGAEFKQYQYVPEPGGIARAYDVFRWASLGDGDRLLLIYWIVCLPILRRVGQVPLVRIEGGSSSGKTRAVDGIGQLVNGTKGSSVPTAAALVSRLSREMLTIDDNRESGDVSRAFLGTLLQATHLGAREKRRGNSDTGTVLERVCGALVMNGVEPIHDGKPELASRMMTLRCDAKHMRDDSPRDTGTFMLALSQCRDAFWSEAARACAAAMLLDQIHGEGIGAQIEHVFGATRIGRLSLYLRLMYLAWVSGLASEQQPAALETLAPLWVQSFGHMGEHSLSSLIDEELCVQALEVVFAYGAETADKDPAEPEFRKALQGKYVEDPAGGIEFLGPLRPSHLARLARTAGKALNAPRSVQDTLRSGQLAQRLLDGLEFVRAAGFEIEIQPTNKGRDRWTFSRELRRAPDAERKGSWETWDPR